MPFTRKTFASWSLQRKIAAVVIFLVFVRIIADLSIQGFVIAPSFDALEQDEAVRAARRGTSTFKLESLRMLEVAEKWASWDDTYQFATDRNEAYIKNNLSLAAFRHARLNVIGVYNAAGELVWGGLLDPDAAEPAISEPAPSSVLPSFSLLARQNDSTDRRAGVFVADGKAMLLAMMPIHTNAGTGPSRGTLVMGKYIGKSLLANFSEQAGVELSVWPISSGTLPPDKAPILNEISVENPYVCRAEEPRTTRVFSVLPDLENGSGVLVEARVVEYITSKGAMAARNAFLSSITSGIVILTILLVFLRAAIIRPIRELTGQVVRFSLSGTPVDPTIETNGDELHVLSQEFDAMKTRLLTDVELRRQSEARMQAILVSAPDGIITVDERGVIESINPAATDMFGYAPDEMVGRNWGVLVADPVRALDDERLDHASSQLGARKDDFEYENTGVRKDGSTFPLHVTASVVELGDRNVTLGIFRDITDLTRMHERLLRTEHLAAIGEMGASVAHEIRNPIAGISGAVQVLRDTMPPADERREIIQEIIAQVGRVDQTLRELLMLAKPWSPELKLCSVRGFLSRAIERAKVQEAFQHVTFEIQKDGNAFANMDEFLMEQVLWNLFRNAAQAMPNGGTIRCAIENVQKSVRIVVADTGVGIPPDVVDKVFRPFFTTKTRGTGLGLAVVRQIVDAHGASIAIDSTPGEGTRITIELPQGESPRQAATG